ncbi:MAG: Disulfide bond formation protein B [Alphaproteobacteria bacterium MarineAlpha11_Bin1]|nr:MAG: Disulfide bond formation protein B [Alphaproteobacteria bacterium MarineAlpha11_Bin1]
MKIGGITIDDRDVPLWAMAASAIALLLALGSQYLGGLAPCNLCVWQRVPHGVVILIGIGALLWFRGPRERLLLTWASMVALTIGAGIALYHSGVEQHWIAGPPSCSGEGGVNSTQSLDELRKMLLATPVVRCDEIPWSLFGLSIAAWNAVTSFVLAAFCSVAGWRQLKDKNA